MIESVNNERIKEYAKLNMKKYRDETGMFIIEGEHLVEEAHKYYEIIEIFSLDGREGTTKVSENVMSKLSNLKNIPPILAVVKKNNSSKIKGNIVLLDGIQDPGNLGTIIRSAVAFGVDTIVLSENTVDEYNSKVLRASEGLFFQIDIIRTNIENLLNDLKEDYIILTTDVNDGLDIKDIDIDKNYILIMGNEGYGVRNTITNLADYKLYIPIKENVESLNVGVATSILLYELSRK